MKPRAILVFVFWTLFHADARSQEIVDIAHSALSASQAILFVTRDAGIFRKYNLEPRIIYIVGGPTNTAALISGSVDFNIFAGPASVAANLGGADTVLLMTFVNTLEHAVFTHPSITKPSDLRGKRIGIARPGSADHYAATVALRKWNLDPEKSVNLISIGGPPDRYLALQAGRVDAILIQPPLTTRAQKAGFQRLAALVDFGVDYVGTSLGTTRAVIRKKEELVRRVVSAFVEGIHFYKTNKEASLRTIARLMRTQDAEALEEAYSAYAVKFMARVPYPTTRGVEAVLEDLAKNNPKAKGADPRRFVEPRFLKELEDSGFISRLYGK
ncbi:MAG TPA: ABC transporter substrate-binding protein [candidate division Zixibacteria bacterium]|nr:ABC transporter substrate-binding protein [candidate division Zixibacteria bacterium]